MSAVACELGCEGIVSKRIGSIYQRGRSPLWPKVKNPKAPAVKREASFVNASPRRFPPPWSVEESDACFVARDHNGQQLARLYYRSCGSFPVRDVYNTQ